MDQPTIDGLNTYIISKAVRQRGIVVALNGQGGDELFGGYPSFTDVPKLQQMMRRLVPLPASVRRILFGVMSAGKPTSYRQKLLDIADAKPGLLPLYLHRRRLMSDQQLRDMGVRPSSELFLPMETVAGLPVDATDARFAISIFESRLYQQNILLRDSDVFGMASSLEIRVPLLDQRVADLAFSLPGAFRAPPKTLLRRAFPDLLRTEVLEQSKRGFTLPVRRWMRGQLREFCVAAIDRVKSSSLLSPTGVQQVWDQFEREPESPAWTRALALVVLGSQLHKLQTMAAAPPVAEAAV
jgi:asparagine synthase (glutamine-hydrolysing)